VVEYRTSPVRRESVRIVASSPTVNWRDAWRDRTPNRRQSVREDAAFRNWINADGSAGPPEWRL
jgi:hypothetical protein